MTGLWGEYETSEMSNEEGLPPEVVKLFIMKAMQQDSSKVSQPLPRPDEDQPNEVNLIASGTLGLEMDDTVLHTIKLMQHSNEMSQLIETAKEQMEFMGGTSLNSFPPAINIPIKPEKKVKCKLNYPVQPLNKDFSDFTLGKGPKVPEVTFKTAKKLLKKSVAALLAHAGYQTTKESVLNTLSDVVEEYIKKMTMLLRVAVDQGANAMATGFPDAIERVFHDMNIGSVRSIHKYYQTRVIKYHEKLLEECKLLNWEYNNISVPIKTDLLGLESLAKIEPDDVPELHFPGLGDEEVEGVDELQPSLEPGFQMLHSLEQDVRFKHVDNKDEEKVPVNDSFAEEVPPGNVHVPSKRRRRM